VEVRQGIPHPLSDGKSLQAQVLRKFKKQITEVEYCSEPTTLLNIDTPANICLTHQLYLWSEARKLIHFTVTITHLLVCRQMGGLPYAKDSRASKGRLVHELYPMDSEQLLWIRSRRRSYYQ
jgi:hypothetical protein